VSAEGDLLAHKARSLAQTHPFTALAKRYADRAAAAQQKAQSLAVVADWSAAALTAGYCLRRVEENEAGVELAARSGVGPELAELERASTQVAAEVRAASLPAGPPGGYLLEEAVVVAALDRIITSEIGRRHDNVRAGVDDEAWAEFEDYLAYWVVQGYALRVAEAATGALA